MRIADLDGWKGVACGVVELAIKDMRRKGLEQEYAEKIEAREAQPTPTDPIQQESHSRAKRHYRDTLRRLQAHRAEATTWLASKAAQRWIDASGWSQTFVLEQIGWTHHASELLAEGT